MIVLYISVRIFYILENLLVFHPVPVLTFKALSSEQLVVTSGYCFDFLKSSVHNLSLQFYQAKQFLLAGNTNGVEPR